jgi:hypothetical protein
MPFEARVFIQGVANLIPHQDGTSLVALFPDQSLYDRVRTPGQSAPEEICRHYPMVQLDSRHLTGAGRIGEPGLHEIGAPWTTIHLDREWVGFEVEGNTQRMNLGNGIPGVPSIEQLLVRAGLGGYTSLEPSVLPTPGDPDPSPDLLAGGLYLEHGVVSPASDFTGSVRFQSLTKLSTSEGRARPTESERSEQRTAETRENDQEVYGNTLKVELGMVEQLTLKLRRFDEEDVRKIQLHPVGDTLDVWVRYFCEVDPPTPKCPDATDDAGDEDFLLNYLLRADARGLFREAARLTIPRLTTSWLHGRPIGNDCVRCMCSGGNGGNHSTPF